MDLHAIYLKEKTKEKENKLTESWRDSIGEEVR